MDIVILIFVVAFGACIGSFMNVVIYRLPLGRSIVFPGSFCPTCGQSIHWYDNIPLVSWLVLGGRCRFCKAPISPRYLAIEAATAFMVAGLYACFYMLGIRDGAGEFSQTWAIYVAHTTLLCGLLVCAAVDLENWIVPLEVCWFVSLIGLAAATIGPSMEQFLPPVSATIGAMSIAAAVGLIVALILQKHGFIQPSFIDAEPPRENAAGGIAFTKASGVNPRREILREVIFLAPSLILACAAWLLVIKVQYVGTMWNSLNDVSANGNFAVHFGGFQAALFGYLIGGLWIWGIRIFGTLAFGKEAMGLGDVHILAAVGAVTGWIIPSLVFFLAPIFGLLWALYLLLVKRRRELPYGPWLAAASLVVILFYDAIIDTIAPYFRAGN